MIFKEGKEQRVSVCRATLGISKQHMPTSHPTFHYPGSTQQTYLKHLSSHSLLLIRFSVGAQPSGGSFQSQHFSGVSQLCSLMMTDTLTHKCQPP